MNKIKLLMLLILAATGMTVSAADAGYDFVESDGGKTLTIKGYGDLTTCSQTGTEIVFSAAANGNIFTNNSGTSVNAQDAYNPSATYYYADREYTQVFNGGAPTAWSNGVGNVNTTWNETAINTNDTYLYKVYLMNGKIIINSDRITSGSPGWYNKFQYNGDTYVEFAKLSSAANFGAEVDPTDDILLTEAELANYLTTTYAVSGTIYRSQDGGATKQPLTIGQTYTYNAGDLFYTTTGNFTYTQIADNAAFFAANPVYLESIEATTTFKGALLAKINSGAYTKVVFENTGSGELIIDPDISQKILFPYIQYNQYYGAYAKNTNIETLDMGEATLKLSDDQSFKDIVSMPTGDSDLCNLTSFTIPMMPKGEDGEMTLPAWALISMFPGNSNLETLTVPVGYTELGEASLALNASITTINLPEGLKKIDAQVFSTNTSLAKVNITGAAVEGRSIVLPSTLEEIGKEAFASTAIASTEDDPFILPSSLKKIGAAAFYELKNLTFLQLNEGLEYVGNSAFAVSSMIYQQTSITFPSTIKYLAPFSFMNRWYQDIYFTSDVAPVCPIGYSSYLYDWPNNTAFSANIQMGNDGFDANGTWSGSSADDTSLGYANRENYVNNGYYFTVLHFPTDTSDEAEMTYKDITRRYVTGTWDESGNFSYSGYGSAATFAYQTDPVTGETYGSAFKETTTYSYGNMQNFCTSNNVQPGFIDTYQGEQTVWPSQAQWMRYYIMVANGLSWDGVTEYRPTVTEEMFNMMKEDGLVVSHDDDEAGIDLADIDSYSDLTDAQKDYLSKILYQGTRRFVLSYDSPYNTPFVIDMEGGRWWTFCAPFNMTKAQVDEVFGKGTHVCLFSGVDRTTDTDGKTLRLKFVNDVYHHKTDRIVTSQNDGNALVYTYGGNYSTANGEPAADDIVIYARESYMIYPTNDDVDPSQTITRNFGTPDFAIGDPLPTVIQANSETPYTIDGNGPAYRFIGNFTTNASYDASTNTFVTVKIPRYSYAYGTMGGETKFFIMNTDKATWAPFKSIVQNISINGGLNDWTNFFLKSSANVKQISVFGMDEDITGVENVIIEASSDNGADKAVYSISGTQAGDSLQGLAPGVYVKQGKAYIVK